jgi:hypothetical protein
LRNWPFSKPFQYDEVLPVWTVALEPRRFDKRRQVPESGMADEGAKPPSANLAFSNILMPVEVRPKGRR